MTTPRRRSPHKLSPRGTQLVPGARLGQVRFVTPAQLEGLVACPDCDLLTHRVAVPVGGRAFCPRCGALLFRHRVRPVERTFATSLSALVLYLAALAFPFLHLEMAGRAQECTLADCVRRLGEQGTPSMAALVAITGLIAPAVLIGSLLFLSASLQFDRAWPGRKLVARLLTHVQPWAMAEVYLLGVLVSLLKLTKEADITFGAGSAAFAAMVLVLTASQSAFDPEAAWRTMHAADDRRAATSARRARGTPGAAQRASESTSMGFDA